MRGERFIIGASILQTPGGVQSELSKIDHEIDAHDHELAVAVAAHGGNPPKSITEAVQHGIDIATGKAKPEPTNDPLVNFYHATWLPFVAGWKTWFHDNDGWIHNLMWNEAPTAEGYQRKLAELRNATRDAGYTFVTPGPDIEGMSIADPRRAGIGEALETLGGAAKIALYGGLAIGGIFAIAKIVETVRRS